MNSQLSKSLVGIRPYEVSMDLTLLLQIWGGAGYLLNKLFFAKAERAGDFQRRLIWLRWAWIAYLVGLPPWVYIFISERNWIAAAVESSGVPAMLMGLIASWQARNQDGKHTWLDYLAKLMIVTGIGLSLYDAGGLTQVTQFMELGVAAGFLLGTYLMAKGKPQGYFWLMVGNVSAASLMLQQGYYVLGVQQLVSLALVLDAFRVQRQTVRSLV